jgi:urease accessory protein
MQRVISVIPPEEGAGAAAVIVLDHDRRTRRRSVLTLATGESILLDMPQVTRLRDGDRLKLDDGRVVRIAAAEEALLEITAPDADALVRIAWHLGNRHLPTQLTPSGLRIRTDHVIEEMVNGLGGACVAISAPFDPERGAYETGAAARGTHSHHHHDH